MTAVRSGIGGADQPVVYKLMLDGEVPVVLDGGLVYARRLVGDRQHGQREIGILRRREWRGERVLHADQWIAEWAGRRSKCPLRTEWGHVGDAVVEDARLPRVVKNTEAAANAGLAVAGQ